jgi:V8-like Glu-specific endopeptidase
MHKFLVVLNVPILAALIALLQTSVFAQSGDNVSKQNDEITANSTSSYWTPDRLKKARPAPLPLSSNEVFVENRTVPAIPTGLQQSSPGLPPQVRVQLEKKPLFKPDEINSTEIQPNNVGTQNAHFTSSQVVPLTADTAYPYSTVGKLFFTQPGLGDFVCSAAVIRPRLILTAGHCVHKGSGGNGGFFTNFVFIPAFRDGSTPFKQWSWSRVITTNTWATGNSTFPNAADYAIIEIPDQYFNQTNRRIGEVTGYLGYMTNKLLPNHVTMLGYPGNLDSGNKIHQVTAGSYAEGGNNTAIYGSDMRGGSSGGPWIQNFGVFSSGQVDGQNKSPNQIVGVTSYGTVAVGPLIQGSSILDDRFIEMLNTACNWDSRNCQ